MITLRVPGTLAFLLSVLSPVGQIPAEAQKTLLSPADLMSMEVPAPDHRISYGAGEYQFGHLRLPEGDGPYPVVAFIHGGCFLSAFDITHAGPLEAALAEAGYAVWSLEYRRVGNEGGGWPGTFLDVAMGLDHLRALAPRYGLDLGRVVASGHSAGGNLALWASARAEVPRDSEVWTDDPLPIHGVVALAPAPNMAGLHEAGVCGNVVDALMGGSPEEVPGRYDATSPMRLAPIDAPQTVIIGALDRAWGPVGRAYVERARSSGDDDLHVVEAPESGHFEMIAPGTSNWTLVLEAFRGMFSSLRH